MESLNDALLQLENILKVVNPKLLYSLNSGIGIESEIKKNFIDLDLTVNDEILTFYKWKNGIDEKDIELDARALYNPIGIFFDLNTMKKYYEMLILNEFIEKHYFPISSENTCLVNLDKYSIDYGRIFIYSPSLLIIEPITIYDTLTSMFNTIINCFDEKIFWYDDMGYLQIEWDLYKEVGRKNNPYSKYWKRY